MSIQTLSNALKYMLIANVAYPLVARLFMSFVYNLFGPQLITLQFTLGVLLWLVLLATNIYHIRNLGAYRKTNIALLILNGLAFVAIGEIAFITGLYVGVPLLISML